MTTEHTPRYVHAVTGDQHSLHLLARILRAGPEAMNQAVDELEHAAVVEPDAIVRALCGVIRASRGLATDAGELAETLGWQGDEVRLEDRATLASTEDERRELGDLVDDAAVDRLAEALPRFSAALLAELASDVELASQMHDPIDRILGYLHGDVAREIVRRVAVTELLRETGKSERGET